MIKTTGKEKEEADVRQEAEAFPGKYKWIAARTAIYFSRRVKKTLLSDDKLLQKDIKVAWSDDTVVTRTANGLAFSQALNVLKDYFDIYLKWKGKWPAGLGLC